MPVISSPVIQLNASRTVALLGDSITAANLSDDGESVAYNSPGYGCWLRVLSNQRIDIPPDYVQGVAGETSVQIAARIGDIVALKPGACVVLSGTNDGALTYQQTIDALDTIYTRLYRAGVFTIAMTILPRGNITTALYQKIHRINRWIESQRYTRKNFIVVDPMLDLVDLSTGEPKTGYTQDLLHPTPIGGYYISQQLVSQINTLYPVSPKPFSNRIDTYHATNNPYGNLMSTTGLMEGTGGTLSNGATGDLATGWICDGTNIPSGAALALAKVTKADGRTFQEFTWSGNYNSASPGSIDIRCSSVHTNVAAGDILEGMCEFESDGDAENISMCSLLLNCLTPSGNRFYLDMNADNDVDVPAIQFSGLLRTPKLTVPGTPTSVWLSVRTRLKSVTGASDCAGTFRFGSMSLRKVPS